MVEKKQSSITALSFSITPVCSVPSSSLSRTSLRIEMEGAPTKGRSVLASVRDHEAPIEAARSKFRQEVHLELSVRSVC